LSASLILSLEFEVESFLAEFIVCEGFGDYIILFEGVFIKLPLFL